MLIKEMNERFPEDVNGNSNIAVEDRSDKNLITTPEGLGYLPEGFQGGFLFNLLGHDYNARDL